MRYIITGSTGFIGYALAKRLLSQGNDVTAVVRPGSKNANKLSGVDGKQLRIVELPMDEIEKLHSQYNIRADVFYHLAWNGSAGQAREDFDIQYTNVKYTAEAIRTAKVCGCQRFIGAGSQAEYGVVRDRAYEDITLPNPFMMYGAAKLASYEMGRVLARQMGITFVWPRIYSVYGVGENPGTLVNYVIDSLMKGEVPQLSPCENMWNFIYIDDCVKMLHALGESDSVRDGIYHVASEDTRVLKDFVTEIRDIVAPEINLNLGARESNPERTFWLDPDTTKIQSISGKCQWTFGQGIREKRNDNSVHHNERSTE